MKKLLILSFILVACFAFSQGSTPLSVSIVTLAWTPVATTLTNQVTYTMFVGTNSGVYNQTIQAGTNTTSTASNLVNGPTYYFSVTASVGGFNSGYSTEATYSITNIVTTPANLRVINISP